MADSRAHHATPHLLTANACVFQAAYPRVRRSGGRFGFDIGYEMYDALGIYDPAVYSRSKKLAADTRSYRDSA